MLVAARKTLSNFILDWVVFIKLLQEMFTLVTAEISNDILSTKRRHDVEDVLKTFSLSAIKIRKAQYFSW
jgi:hypothetical protein